MKNDFGYKYQIGGIGKLLINNFYQKLGQLIGGLKITNILEVGAGEGYSSQILQKLLPANANFDISEFEIDLIDKIKEKVKGCQVTQDDIYGMNKQDSQYDLIFCLEVLEHLEKPIEAIRELQRVTNKYVILSIPNEPLWRVLNMARGKYWGDFGNTPGHLQHWNVNSIQKLTSEYFTIEKIVTPLPWIILLLKKK
jgi:2-polyprenyl-3-methyl-5-hydroxy-6-metoxy-1,4-benzoquinol methylase